jgi:ABC-type nickel/cobalt efflux system permease component RcnA
MISTVTTTTVTTVTTVALAGSLGLFLTVTLMVCLIKKEIVSPNHEDLRARGLSKILNIVIVPMLMVFLLLAMSKLHEVLGS